MIRRIVGTFLLMMLASVTVVQAQDETEYRMEVGPAAGMSFYMGDANNRLFNHNGFCGGIVARYNVNHRLALKADLMAAKIAGSSTDMKDRTYPQPLSFSRTIYDFGVQVEGHFLAYGTTTYDNCHRLVPYYLLGIGMTFAPEPARNDFAANFPIGIGIKYKLTKRLNVSLEWTMRFSTSDRLDVTQQAGEDPFQIKSGFMKNRDSYSFTMLMLTYDIFSKPCNCN